MFKKLLLTTILASASTLIIPQTDAHAQRPGKQAVQEHRQKTQQKHQETKEQVQEKHQERKEQVQEKHQEHKEQVQEKHQETKENREEHKETIGKKLGDHIPESPETE